MAVQAAAVDESFAKPADGAQLDRATEVLRANGFVVHLVDTVTDARELVLSLLPDGARCSPRRARPCAWPGSRNVHAVSEDGVLLVGSASGSQLAPYASGARKAIWVVGAQKLVPDVATGLRRIRDYSLPKEWRRLQESYGQTSFIGKILIVEREALPERGVVVLIRDSVGF